MILMIDNYDSFTYNLVQYLGQLGEEVAVRRNDEITLVEIEAMKPEAIFLSPGPCSPEQAGSPCDVVRTFHTADPHHGGLPGPPGDRLRLRRPGRPGGAGSCTARPPRSSTTGGRSSRGSPSPFPAGRYHSLIVERETLPDCLEISAETEEGEIMGLRHSKMARGGDPVSSRIDPDAGRKTDHLRIFSNCIDRKREEHAHDQGSNCQGRSAGRTCGKRR